MTTKFIKLGNLVASWDHSSKVEVNLSLDVSLFFWNWWFFNRFHNSDFSDHFGVVVAEVVELSSSIEGNSPNSTSDWSESRL